MKKFKWSKMIDSFDDEIRIKDLIKKSLYAVLPIVSVKVIEKFLRGKYYIKFSNYPNSIISKFLKNDCRCLSPDDTLASTNFFHVMDGLKNEDKSNISHMDLIHGGNVFISKNRSFIFSSKDKKGNRRPYRNRDGSIYIVGIDFQKDVEILQKYYIDEQAERKNNLGVYTLKGVYMLLTVKAKENIFSDQLDHVIDTLNSILYKFKASKNFSVGANSAIILHGKPGTGKSLISKYIAKLIEDKYDDDDHDVDITYVTKNDFNKDDLIKKITKKVGKNNSSDVLNVIIIDDCDMIMSPRVSEKDKDKKMKEEKPKVNITGDLLELLDNGIPEATSPLLIIMTTNYIDRIDQAILRPGRTDGCIEIKDISANTARNMTAKYNIDFSKLETLYPHIKGEDGLYNPATVQQSIINYLSHRPNE